MRIRIRPAVEAAGYGERRGLERDARLRGGEGILFHMLYQGAES